MRRALEQYPFLPLFLAYLCGIVAADALLPVAALPWEIGAFVVALALSALLRKPPIQTILFVIAFFLFGVELYHIQEKRGAVTPPQGYGEYEVVVTGEPVEKAKWITADITILSGRYKGRRVRASFRKEDKYNNKVDARYIALGSTMKIYTKLQTPKNFDNDSTSHFDYVRYLRIRHIPFVTYIYPRYWHPERISLGGMSVLERARLRTMKFRHTIIEAFRQYGLQGQELAAVAAMTLGDKSLLSPSTKQIYSYAGASHILALSGLHVSIIYFMLTFSLGARARLSLPIQMAIVFAVWVYVFIVGMPAPAVRAASMLTVCSFAYLTFRGHLVINAIMLSAFVMTMLNPLALFDLGFQLSYSAVISIVIWTPLLSRLAVCRFLSRNPVTNYLCQAVEVSLAAQIGTAPLVAYSFSRLPNYFFLTNMVVSPVVMLVIYLAVVFVVLFLLGMSFPVVASLAGGVVWLLSLVASLLHWFLGLIAAMPGSVVEGIDISALQVLVVYVFIVAATLLMSILMKDDYLKASR